MFFNKILDVEKKKDGWSELFRESIPQICD